ncbi:hypothetical protein GCM10017673_18370 [Streptosporangium violaceochromogenes]|nr:hypothetical protein GCM10017673_18370 [Streptosporangium violaceochromogenes]
MTAPHDPVHLARLTFRWRDEHWHLIEEPTPVVVLVSDHLSKGDRYPSRETAETAFWLSVTGSLLSHSERLASASWPGIEVAVIYDCDERVHLAERLSRPKSSPACRAWTFTSLAEGTTAFLGRLHVLTKAGHSANPH